MNILLESMRELQEDIEINESLPRELAYALGAAWSRHPRIDYEKSEIKEITKEEALEEIKNGNKENLFTIRIDKDYRGKPEYIPTTIEGKITRYNYSFTKYKDAVENSDKFYLLVNKVENPNYGKYYSNRDNPENIIPGGDTGRHENSDSLPFNTWRNKQERRDRSAGAEKYPYDDEFRGTPGNYIWGHADKEGNYHYNLDRRNRYALSLYDLQKNMVKLKDLKNRLRIANLQIDQIDKTRIEDPKYDKKRAKEKANEIKKLSDKISELEAQLQAIKNEPDDTLDYRKEKYTKQISEIQDQINNMFGRPTATEELNEDLIIIEADKAKDKLYALKDEIEKAEGNLKFFLKDLFEVYMYHAFFGGVPASSDERDELKAKGIPTDELIHSDLTKKEWDDLAEWSKGIEVEFTKVTPEEK